MFEEVPVVLPSVTKMKRKDSPGLSPAGVWRAILLALARLPTPSPIQQITMAIASLCVCVLFNILGAPVRVGNSSGGAIPSIRFSRPAPAERPAAGACEERVLTRS